jgi:hypothetical protein
MLGACDIAILPVPKFDWEFTRALELMLADIAASHLRIWSSSTRLGWAMSGDVAHPPATRLTSRTANLLDMTHPGFGHVCHVEWLAREQLEKTLRGV